MCRRKRALHNAMEALEEEVEKGNVNSGAHVALSKKLKAAYEATPSGRKMYVEKFLLTMLSEDASASMSIPYEYREFVISAPFLRKLMARTRLYLQKKEIPNKWWRDLLAGLLPDWMFEGDNWREDVFVITATLLQVKWHTLERLEAHLDRVAPAPSKAFPYLHEIEEDEDECLPFLLVLEPRFLRWLLKEGHGYSPEEQMKLRKRAFETVDHSLKTEAFHDDGFLRAMGLKNAHGALMLSMTLALGKDFAEALAQTQAWERNDQPRTHEVDK